MSFEKLRAREWQAHRPGLLAVRGGKGGKENANKQVVEHLES